MKKLFVGIVCFACFAGLFVPTHAQEKKEKGIQGVWKPTKVIQDGQPAPESLRTKLTFTVGDKIITVTHSEQERIDKSGYKLDKTKKPKHIDITPMSGRGKGKVIKGIYKLEKDTLTICYGIPRKDEKQMKRPTMFSAPKGSKRALVVFQRKK